MNGNTYTNSLEPSIEANIISRQLSEDPEDDLEAIGKELTDWDSNATRLQLIKLAVEIGREHVPEELLAMKEKARKEALPFSQGEMELFNAFWNATISYSMSLAEKEKDCRQDPCNESEPADTSDRIALQQDDSISIGQ